ncbi:MAG: glycosyltransferase family 39 protein [Planctomycetes bacterium]|nr:glycosyltransferase family 39 protein [Planctomycetota bacterium]
MTTEKKSVSLPPRRVGFLLCAALILVCGVSLRTVGLGRRGLTLYDEGIYLCEARYVAGAVRSIPSALRYAWIARVAGEKAPGELAELKQRMSERVASGIYPIFHKNTHTLFLALLSFVTGEGDWLGSAVGALFGVATLLLVLVRVTACYGEAGGLLATLALALCPLHILECRSAMAEGDGTFLLVLASFLAHAAVRDAGAPLRKLFVAGVVTGLCFTVNYRLAVAPAVVTSIVGAGMLGADRPLAGRRLRACLWLGVGMLLPLLGWELIFRAGFWLLGEWPWGEQRTYFTRLCQYMDRQGLPELGVGDPSCLPFYFANYVGWPLVLLAACGFALEAWRQRSDALVAALPVCWLLAFLLLRSREQCLRYVGPVAPFFAVAAGALLRPSDGADRSNAWKRWVAGSVAGLALLAQSVVGPKEWLYDQSGLPATFAYLREARRPKPSWMYFYEDPPLAAYYDPPGMWCEPVPRTFAEFKSRFEHGTRWLVVTPPMMTHYRFPPWFEDLVRDLDEKCPPREFAHPAGALPYFAYELSLYGKVTSFAESREAAEALALHGGTVRVYDLYPYFRRR